MSAVTLEEVCPLATAYLDADVVAYVGAQCDPLLVTAALSNAHNEQVNCADQVALKESWVEIFTTYHAAK